MGQILFIAFVCIKSNSANKESAHPPRNGFSQALESRYRVPKNEAQCA